MLKEGVVAVLAEKQLINNPFGDLTTFNQPLHPDLCQQIYATALRRLSRDRQLPTPPSLSTLEVQKRIGLYGFDSCLLHPKDLLYMFRGVTLAVYQTIKMLYCSRFERSISIVTRILHAMAKQRNVPCLTNEAIWAICLSLEKVRRAATLVTTQQISDLWWVGEIAGVRFPVYSIPSEHKRPLLAIGVIDVERSHVLAIQVGEPSCREQLYTLALYEAVSSVRHPDPEGATGLIWSLPAKLAADELPLSLQQFWNEMFGIPVEMKWTAFPLLDELRVLWENLLSARDLSFEQWGMAFESVLNRRYGTSPIRTKEENEHRFGSLHGYMSDPAWLFPALRMFLPSLPARITQAGTICHNKSMYVDELLCYWPQTPVTIRPSAWDEATIWVYLDENILCQARACQFVGREHDALPSHVS